MPNSAAPPTDAPPPRLRAKRGRKPKSAPDKRQHLVACRLTDAEQAQLERGRGALSAGEWLRTLALARRLPRAIPEINLEAYAELARASANLNQLSRRAHIAGQLEIAELSAALGAFRLALLGVTPATLDDADEESEVDAAAPGEHGADGLGQTPA